MQSFESMVARYGVKADWSGNKANLKGTGVSGDIAVSDTAVTVTLKLGMLARMAGVDPERLQQSIEKRLSAAFGEA
jgi:putative polyhydroxyalkanoate system protein